MKIAEAHPRLKDPIERKKWSLERAISSSLLEGMYEAVKPIEKELKELQKIQGNSTVSTAELT